ncbi:unnamed protein product [Phaedon cochleariae]|uniref:NADP-dependent oxidoreductase domain-containing protein n=1 Tax=Phaedon cochleariae TaxID=80249 RepID=A0A9N9WX23_PHACE|nr:unnamed protein product [Phaedon cochleariae]
MHKRLLAPYRPILSFVRSCRRCPTSCRSRRVPFVQFNDGETFPIFGLGTWKSKPDQVCRAVQEAIDVGYRHIDCAAVYENEREVGAGIKAKLDDGTVKREELYITSKLWNTMHRPEKVEKAIKGSLEKLGLEYLDLYLIHWPFALKEGCELFPVNEDGSTAYGDINFVDTWKAMEEVHKNCLTKSIGISNFNKRQTECILENCSIKPVTNQIELHAYLNQKKLVEFLTGHDIIVTAYSPLGSADRPWAKPDEPRLLMDPLLQKLSKKYQKTPAQILLRLSVECGYITIPKSVTKSRIEENFSIWDFSLYRTDVELLDGLNRDYRYCAYPDACTHKDHPFAKDEY